MTRSRTLLVLTGALSAALAAATTHIVVSGDTLWDISGRYLGDPFQWPTIWKKNPQIADAHWIYPGDTIHLADGRDSIVPGQPGDSLAAPAPESGDELAGFPLNPDLLPPAVLDTTPQVRLAESPAQSVLNPDAMKLAPVHFLPSEVSLGVESTLDWAFEGSRHMIRPGTVVGIAIGTEKGAEVGSLMEIVEANDRVLVFRDPKVDGRYEQVRGICVVVEVTADSSSCLLQRVYGDAGIHSVARPYVKPVERTVTSFEPVSDEQSARVFANTRNSRLQLPGSYVIVDRGSSSGVGEGDIFEFMAANERRGIAAMRGYGIVVRTTASSSTIFMVGVRQRPVMTGDRAWRIRKAV